MITSSSLWVGARVITKDLRQFTVTDIPEDETENIVVGEADNGSFIVTDASEVAGIVSH